MISERRCGLDTARLQFSNSAFAKTFLAVGRIDLSARLCWLLNPLKARAVTGRANNFGRIFAYFFHNHRMLNLFARQ
jgi:hypothetical protein